MNFIEVDSVYILSYLKMYITNLPSSKLPHNLQKISIVNKKQQTTNSQEPLKTNKINKLQNNNQQKTNQKNTHTNNR